MTLMMMLFQFIHPILDRISETKPPKQPIVGMAPVMVDCAGVAAVVVTASAADVGVRVGI